MSQNLEPEKWIPRRPSLKAQAQPHKKCFYWKIFQVSFYNDAWNWQTWVMVWWKKKWWVIANYSSSTSSMLIILKQSTFLFLTYQRFWHSLKVCPSLSFEIEPQVTLTLACTTHHIHLEWFDMGRYGFSDEIWGWFSTSTFFFKVMPEHWMLSEKIWLKQSLWTSLSWQAKQQKGNYSSYFLVPSKVHYLYCDHFLNFPLLWHDIQIQCIL